MKYAWIEADKIRDICHGDPVSCYHPDVAQFYITLVPDDAENGDGWIDGQLVKPEPAPPAPRTWGAEDIRKNLTLGEKVKWDNDSLPEIITAKQEMSAPRNLEDTTEVLEVLVAVGAISQISSDKILA
jgi:hypothetical protein